MDFRMKQGLVFGLIVGVALAAFFYAAGWGAISLILVPIGAVMGLAPQMMKQKDEEE
ncbi:MAG: hypothetical protein Q4Q58_04575 [Thermoplasmata archaeon]|nr:hypothetical protein [Thermoplasmata archaeon]